MPSKANTELHCETSFKDGHWVIEVVELADMLEFETEDPDAGDAVIELVVPELLSAPSGGGVGVACCPLTMVTKLSRRANAMRMVNEMRGGGGKQGENSVQIEGKLVGHQPAPT